MTTPPTPTPSDADKTSSTQEATPTNLQEVLETPPEVLLQEVLEKPAAELNDQDLRKYVQALRATRLRFLQDEEQGKPVRAKKSKVPLSKAKIEEVDKLIEDL